MAFASGPENLPGPLFLAGRGSAANEGSPTKASGLVGTDKPVDAGALVAYLSGEGCSSAAWCLSVRHDLHQYLASKARKSQSRSDTRCNVSPHSFRRTSVDCRQKGQSGVTQSGAAESDSVQKPGTRDSKRTESRRLVNKGNVALAHAVAEVLVVLGGVRVVQ